MAPDGTQNYLFTYLRRPNGNVLPITGIGTGTRWLRVACLPRSLPLVGSIIVSVNLLAPGATNGPIYLQSKTGMPNVGVQMEMATHEARHRRADQAGGSTRERGVVLPVVIGLGLAMLILVAVGMSSAASGTIKTNTDEDIKGAISAAYAGVEEYQSRLALDSTYYKFGNPAAPFSAAPRPRACRSRRRRTTTRRSTIDAAGHLGRDPEPGPERPEPHRRLLPLRGRQQRLRDEGRDPTCSRRARSAT